MALTSMDGLDGVPAQELLRGLAHALRSKGHEVLADRIARLAFHAEVEALRARWAAASRPRRAINPQTADTLRKLQELHVSGALTEQEFEAARKRLLGL